MGATASLFWPSFSRGGQANEGAGRNDKEEGEAESEEEAEREEREEREEASLPLPSVGWCRLKATAKGNLLVNFSVKLL